MSARARFQSKKGFVPVPVPCRASVKTFAPEVLERAKIVMRERAFDEISDYVAWLVPSTFGETFNGDLGRHRLAEYRADRVSL